ncbi:thioesterase family protein [Phenylobacterium sp. 58.2.17]|uniref:thioesterase family protein n=1 Tax=Phenylobacterium sp. 58.2.17 TaxID=2969306 RepID=UPI0022651B1B|nr:thioesterase family protein [Phenylobacterium sp. 58.2.17]MCX7585504.1 thioesterase family protein [Phenylobacterium sp. 58.2.17]
MSETSANPAYDIALRPAAPGRWTTFAAPEWRNPGGGLWGGYALGLCVRVLEAEPEASGEVLSMTLTYAAGLPSGELDVRTRRLRQGGSIGVWEVELRPRGVEEVGVHGMITMARRPPTPPFAFAALPVAPSPDELPSPDHPAGPLHFGASAFERRTLDGFPPTPGGDSRSLAWVRPRNGVWDKALLAMVTDNSAPRAMYALDRVMTTTLSLTAYLHATVEEIAALGDDFILIECEGRVGGGGASDERSSYWSRDGRLLATSEQLAWYRQAPPPVPE